MTKGTYSRRSKRQLWRSWKAGEPHGNDESNENTSTPVDTHDDKNISKVVHTGDDNVSIARRLRRGRSYEQKDNEVEGRLNDINDESGNINENGMVERGEIADDTTESNEIENQYNRELETQSCEDVANEITPQRCEDMEDEITPVYLNEAVDTPVEQITNKSDFITQQNYIKKTKRGLDPVRSEKVRSNNSESNANVMIKRRKISGIVVPVAVLNEGCDWEK